MPLSTSSAAEYVGVPEAFSEQERTVQESPRIAGIAGYDIDEELTLFERYRGAIFTLAFFLVVAGVFITARWLANGNQSAIRHSDVVSIRIALPPPLPKLQPTPPPQPTPEPVEPKMVEQQPVQDERKPEPPKLKPLDIGPLGTSISGPGTGGNFGLIGGLGGEGGYGAGGGGGTKYGWYASEVQNRIQDALISDPHTRKLAMKAVARIWVDSTGRITRARVTGSGDRAIDTTVENYVLNGLRLTDAPPGDMPLPIVMRIGLERPR